MGSGQEPRPNLPPEWHKAGAQLAQEGFSEAEIDAALGELFATAGEHAGEYSAQGVYAAAHSRLGDRSKSRARPARKQRPLRNTLSDTLSLAERVIEQAAALRPAPPQVPDLLPGERLSHTGRPRSPWRDFRDAGIEWKRWIPHSAWKVVSMIYDKYQSGWGSYDTLAGEREFVPFLPHKVKGLKPRTAREAGRLSVRWGFLEEGPEVDPQGCRLLRPAWLHKPDPAAYLRECLERRKADLRRGKTAAGKLPENGRSSAGLLPDFCRTSAAPPPADVFQQAQEPERVTESQSRPFSPILESQIQNKENGTSDIPSAPETGSRIDWAELRKLPRVAERLASQKGNT